MIAVLDYDAGNLTSVELALQHVGGAAVVTRDPTVIGEADRVVFPGVGSAASCMENLRRFGLDAAIRAAVASGKPTLAICIGLQLLFDHSDEDGGVACLGVLRGQVRRFVFPAGQHTKIPHMGWNEIELNGCHPLLAGVPAGAECYFVHSYYAEPADASHVFSQTGYGQVRFTSAAGRGNLFATQFHPEKSGEVGLAILRNFISWDGTCP